MGSKTARITETSLCNAPIIRDGSISFTFNHTEAGRDMHGSLATGQVSSCAPHVQFLQASMPASEKCSCRQSLPDAAHTVRKGHRVAVKLRMMAVVLVDGVRKWVSICVDTGRSGLTSPLMTLLRSRRNHMHLDADLLYPHAGRSVCMCILRRCGHHKWHGYATVLRVDLPVHFRSSR